MGCAMRSVSGLIGSHDPPSIPKHFAALPLFATASAPAIGTSAGKLKIMLKSAWGSDDPTKAAFPFLHSDALSEAGHEVQIFLLGEAFH
jgi:hypothetical protein